MKPLLLMTLLSAALSLSACRFSYQSHSSCSTRTETYDAPPQSAPASVEDLETRFNAAKGIAGFQQRDEAMADIVADAAKCGNVEMTKRAVDQIVRYPLRDDAAMAACRTFLKQGKRDEALEIAQKITSFVRRDEALREVAK